MLRARAIDLLHQDVDDRRLRRCRQVGAWLLAGRQPRAGSACVRTAVFRPAKEKSSESRCSSGRGKVYGVGVAELGAGAASAGPPG